MGGAVEKLGIAVDALGGQLVRPAGKKHLPDLFLGGGVLLHPLGEGQPVLGNDAVPLVGGQSLAGAAAPAAQPVLDAVDGRGAGPVPPVAHGGGFDVGFRGGDLPVQLVGAAVHGAVFGALLLEPCAVCRCDPGLFSLVHTESPPLFCAVRCRSVWVSYRETAKKKTV